MIVILQIECFIDGKSHDGFWKKVELPMPPFVGMLFTLKVPEPQELITYRAMEVEWWCQYPSVVNVQLESISGNPELSIDAFEAYDQLLRDMYDLQWVPLTGENHWLRALEKAEQCTNTPAKSSE